MTNKEAIEILSRQNCNTCTIKELCSSFPCKYAEALALAIHVLELSEKDQSIDMKFGTWEFIPNRSCLYAYGETICSNCKISVESESKFCPNCGSLMIRSNHEQ